MVDIGSIKEKMASAGMEDISVRWGAGRDAHDEAWAKWWRACFQDMEPSADGNRLYFLYDPVEDEKANGSRKGGPSILIFDTVNRTFFREITVPLAEKKDGVLKNFFLVNAQTNTFCLITDRKEKMTLWHLQLSLDGLTITSGPNKLFGPIPWDMDYMYVMRDDAPEIVYLTGPGLTVWRINAMAPNSPPVDSYKVPGGNIEYYYDAVAWQGKVFICGCNDDESFDFYNVTVLDLNSRQIQRVGCRPDPQAGAPERRKQCGLDRYGGKLYLTGGETAEYRPRRLNDMWTLDLTTFQWERVPHLSLPQPLIEPRLAISQHNGLMHVWGDGDAPNSYAPPPYLAVLKAWLPPPGGGADFSGPPPAYAATPPPPYPTADLNGGSSGEKQPAYMAPSAPPAPYPQQEYPGPGPSQPNYPPQGKKDKDCSIS